MTMQNIKFEELISILKNDDNTPLEIYTVEDLDGNQIRAENLYILDFYHMREWLVESICVDEYRHITIVLNGGNFKDFHFRNVQ